MATIYGAELSLGLPEPQSREAPIKRGHERSEARSAEKPSSRQGVPDPVGTHLLVIARDQDGYATTSNALYGTLSITTIKPLNTADLRDLTIFDLISLLI